MDLYINARVKLVESQIQEMLRETAGAYQEWATRFRPILDERFGIDNWVIEPSMIGPELSIWDKQSLEFSDEVEFRIIREFKARRKTSEEKEQERIQRESATYEI